MTYGGGGLCTWHAFGAGACIGAEGGSARDMHCGEGLCSWHEQGFGAEGRSANTAASNAALQPGAPGGGGVQQRVHLHGQGRGAEGGDSEGSWPLPHDPSRLAAAAYLAKAITQSAADGTSQ
jgi:hypothetical protein